MKVKVLFVCLENRVKKDTGVPYVWREIQYVPVIDDISIGRKVNNENYYSGAEVQICNRVSPNVNIRGLKADSIYDFDFYIDKYKNAVLVSAVETA